MRHKEPIDLKGREFCFKNRQNKNSETLVVSSSKNVSVNNKTNHTVVYAFVK